MYTFIACLSVVLLGWVANWKQRSDREEISENVKYARQDLRLITYLLAAILVMLGMIADGFH